MTPLHIPPNQPLILNGSQRGRGTVKPRIAIRRRAHLLLMMRGRGHPVGVVMSVIRLVMLVVEDGWVGSRRGWPRGV